MLHVHFYFIVAKKSYLLRNYGEYSVKDYLVLIVSVRGHGTCMWQHLVRLLFWTLVTFFAYKTGTNVCFAC